MMALTLSLAQPCAAADGKGKQARKPIDAQLQMFGQMKYTLDGMDLNGYANLKPLVEDLGDAHASRFLKAAQDRDAIALPLILGGSALEVLGIVDGLLRYQEYRDTGERQEYAIFWGCFLGGAAVTLIGALVEDQARVDKFNAVKRYNAVVRGEAEISLMLQPRDEGLTLGLARRF
jgi:hypothetical protein